MENFRWVFCAVALLARTQAWAHEGGEVIRQDVVARPLEARDVDGIRSSAASWFVSTSPFATQVGSLVRIGGPYAGYRQQELIRVRSASVGLGSLQWDGQGATGARGVRFTSSGGAHLALFHSARGGAPFVPDRPIPFELCGSQSAVAGFLGLIFGSRLTIGVVGEAQDDPFHFRWLSGVHAGTGCLGHPPVWTSSETLGGELGFSVVPQILLKARVLREQQRVTYALADEAFGLLSASATSLRLTLEIKV